MTNERDKPASIVDETVSRTYREVADERTPKHLDRAVLAEASRAARPRYARSRAWTRPLAWAATVTLTVAIVLELTQVPKPEEAFFEQERPIFDDAADQPPGTAAAPAAAEAPASSATGRSNGVLPKTPEKTNLMQKTAAPIVTEAEGRQRQTALPEITHEPAAAPVDADAFDIEDKELLRRADEMAEMRYVDSREEMAAPEQAARLQSGALASAVDVCPEEVQRDPESWLNCIQALEEAEMETEAEAQKRLLQEAFPAFELP